MVKGIVHIHPEFDFVVLVERDNLRDAHVEVIHRPHLKNVTAGIRVDAGPGADIIGIRIVHTIRNGLGYAVSY